MVGALAPPVRPITGGETKPWSGIDGPVTRIYHIDQYTPHGLFRRTNGPRERFDPHTPDPAAPAEDPDGRSVLYVAGVLGTCGAEVFGDAREANICPSYRAVVALPDAPLTLQNLVGRGVMGIGALAGLGTGDIPRSESQAWARAIYEDDPTGVAVDGVHYHAAHDGLTSLAIWDRSPELHVAIHPNGTQADLPLTYAPVWRRFLVEMMHRDIVVHRIDSADCHRC